METIYKEYTDMIYKDYIDCLKENGIVDLFAKSFYLISLLGLKYRLVIYLDNMVYIDNPLQFIEKTIRLNSENLQYIYSISGSIKGAE